MTKQKKQDRATDKSKCQKIIDRIESGIPGLDDMICGGFPKNSTIIVRGGTGTGKTSFCLQYLYYGAVEYDDPGVLISFAESKNNIYQHGKGFGWNLEELERRNKFAIVRYEPHEVLKIMEEGGGSIRDTVESIGTKRLVIDSITAYEMLFETKYKANESVLDLFELLRGWGATTLVTAESPITLDMEYKGISGFLSDGVINLYYLRRKQKRRRALEIIKMRDTAHTDKVLEFLIGKAGIKITNELKTNGHCSRR